MYSGISILVGILGTWLLSTIENSLGALVGIVFLLSGSTICTVGTWLENWGKRWIDYKNKWLEDFTEGGKVKRKD